MKTAALVLMALLLAASSVYPAEKHACTYCHSSTPGGASGALLKTSLPELCTGCHEASGEHVTGVEPSMTVVGLPLSRTGRLTCLTCHDPHGKAGHQKLLRLVPAELCVNCHRK